MEKGFEAAQLSAILAILALLVPVCLSVILELVAGDLGREWPD